MLKAERMLVSPFLCSMAAAVCMTSNSASRGANAVSIGAVVLCEIDPRTAAWATRRIRAPSGSPRSATDGLEASPVGELSDE
jgi:hypothetical protein